MASSSPPQPFVSRAVLGRGATSVTWLVARPAAGGTESLAVCKRLIPRAASDEAARGDFDREGAILEALAGRGAPRLVERGEDEAGPYLVMDHVAMTSLATHIAPPAPLASIEWLARAARAAFAVLDLVHTAHDSRGALDVVHGDLAPENLLVDHDGARATLVDFGLASFRDAPLTPGPARGTLLYVAPEQARGEPISPASDRFALAAVVAHVALGEPPRRAEGAAALLLEAGETPLDAYASRAAARFRGIADDVAARLVRDLAFDPRMR